MINIEMAKDYMLRAERCLREARLALNEGDAPSTIRRSQEALELMTKAYLRLIGIEYPKSHDISDILLEYKDRLSQELRNNIEDLSKLISELASIRGPAFYGYEREGIPASQAFSINYAREIFTKVEKYIRLIKNLIENILINSYKN